MPILPFSLHESTLPHFSAVMYMPTGMNMPTGMDFSHEAARDSGCKYSSNEVQITEQSVF
jgi:hypothetical protein